MCGKRIFEEYNFKIYNCLNLATGQCTATTKRTIGSTSDYVSLNKILANFGNQPAGTSDN